MNRTDVIAHLDALIANVQEYATSQGYSITLDRFVIPELTANSRTEVLLYFDVLIVDKGIGSYIVALVDLRNYLMSGTLSRQWVIRVAKGGVDARRLELTSNVTESFGDGFLGTLAVSVSVVYQHSFSDSDNYML